MLDGITQPLADKIRPQQLSELAGQEHLLGSSGVLTNIFTSKQIPSMIFWGPAGCGKTTVAKMLMKLNPLLSAEILSATKSGAEDLRKVFAKAEKLKEMGQGMLLMIDEIHCFRKNQQDLFLPYIEDGTIILIGATTENPSFELNSALLSRCRVVVFKRLTTEALQHIVVRVEAEAGHTLPLTDEARESLLAIADGDARYLINMCEELLALPTQTTGDNLDKRTAVTTVQAEQAQLPIENAEVAPSAATEPTAERQITETDDIDSTAASSASATESSDLEHTWGLLDTEQMLQIIQTRNPIYDKQQDAHYSLISALHKSLRGSDVNAALYWTARMMLGGEHPHYILRRLARCAIEDIGMADPQAIVQVLAAKETYDFLGSPEGDLAVTQAVVYLATAPKSNAQYLAHSQVYQETKRGASYSPPKCIINPSTKLMKELGCGEGYIYDHDTPHCFSGQNYFPEEMSPQEYYHPNARGFEREIQKRLHYWKNLRQQLNH